MDIPDDKLQPVPNFRLEALRDPDARSRFLSALDWFREEIDQFHSVSGGAAL